MQMWLNAFLTRSDSTSSLDGHICQWPVMVSAAFLLSSTVGTKEGEWRRGTGWEERGSWVMWLQLTRISGWNLLIGILSYCVSRVQKKSTMYELCRKIWYKRHGDLILSGSMLQGEGILTKLRVNNNRYSHPLKHQATIQMTRLSVIMDPVLKGTLDLH